jgi:hypothetical protein
LDLTECLAALRISVARVQGGDLGSAEATLMAQATALDAVFGELSRRALLNMGTYLNATDTYLRLALRAQSQCRATLETLATIKNPTVIAKQANITAGPQQVNNRVLLARAGTQDSGQNKLLEEHGTRLDVAATSTAGAGDHALVPLGAFNGAENC